MATAAQTFESQRAYLEFLRARVMQFGPGGMSDSLTNWITLCDKSSRAMGADDIKARLGDPEIDLAGRSLPLPQPKYEPRVTSTGWTARDSGMVGYEIGGSTIYGSGIVLLDGVVFPDCFRSTPHQWLENGWFMDPPTIGFADFDITDHSCTVRLGDKSRLRVLDNTSEYFLFNSNYAATNFGHFLHDLIAQYFAYEYYCGLRGRKLVPILSRRLLFPMQVFVFEALIARLEQTIYLEDGPVTPAVCFASSPPMTHVEGGLLSFEAMRKLRTKVSNLSPPISDERSKGARLFVSRVDSAGAGRQFSNLAQAEELFFRYGFEPIVISQLSVDECLKKFSNCAVMAGVHGAGLMNGLFSKLPLRLIELIDFPGSWPSIHYIYSVCEMATDRIAALPPSPGSGGVPSLDLRRIEEVLATL